MEIVIPIRNLNECGMCTGRMWRVEFMNATTIISIICLFLLLSIENPYLSSQ